MIIYNIISSYNHISVIGYTKVNTDDFTYVFSMEFMQEKHFKIENNYLDIRAYYIRRSCVVLKYFKNTLSSFSL